MKDFVAGESLSGMDNVLFTRLHLIDTVFYSGLKCYIGGIFLGNRYCIEQMLLFGIDLLFIGNTLQLPSHMT